MTIFAPLSESLCGKIKICVFLFVCLFVGYCHQSISKSTKLWTHEEWLDTNENVNDQGKFRLKWNFDIQKQIINLRIEVRSRSWMSLGFSDSYGKHDIMIGWFNGSNAYIQDCYLNNQSELMLDDSQDWNLLLGEINETHIIFEVNRKFQTCDENDFEISEFSEELITHSHGNNSIDNFKDLKNYNLENFKKIHLIQPSYDTNENHTTVDIFINSTIPEVLDIYLCQVIKIEKPLSIIQLNPVLSVPGLVHHMIIGDCSGGDLQSLEEYSNKPSFICDNIKHLPEELKYCARPIVHWTIGNGPIHSNTESVYEFGGKSKYYVLQIHYFNQDLLVHKHVISGFRGLTTINNDYKFKISHIAISAINTNAIIIPPNKSKFTIVTHCLPDCLNLKIGDGKFVKIISAQFHAHKLARSLKLRHFRNGNELPWIFYVNNYLYTNQLISEFITPVTILGGDQLTLECTYDSTDMNYTTIGGETSKDEMCAVWFQYYPKIEKITGWCLSGLTEISMKEITGIKEIEGYGKGAQTKILSPKHLFNTSLNEYLINKTDWSESLENTMRYSPHILECYYAKDKSQPDTEVLVSYPDIKHHYEPPNDCPTDSCNLNTTSLH